MADIASGIAHTHQTAPSETITVQPSLLMRVGFGLLLALAVIVFFGLGVVFVVAVAQAESIWLALFFIAGVAVLLPLTIYLALLFLPMLTRTDIMTDGVRLRSVRWRGAVPLPPLRTDFIPYADIGAVERTDAVFRTFGMTSLQTVWGILARDGRRLELGRTSPHAAANVDYPGAAAAIAERAGLEITDRGAYRMGGIVGSVRRDAPLDASPMSEDQRVQSYGKAARAMQIALALVFLAIAARACTGGE